LDEASTVYRAHAGPLTASARSSSPASGSRTCRTERVPTRRKRA